MTLPDHDTDEFSPMSPEPEGVSEAAPGPTFADTLAGVARWWGENPVVRIRVDLVDEVIYIRHCVPYVTVVENSNTVNFSRPVSADEAYETLRRLAP